ncbi:MAG: hypothetical protein FJY10_04745 [Bacteroidetes bacterium]|nr:hypothetical protein [Bacteroidota bacterium]
MEKQLLQHDITSLLELIVEEFRIIQEYEDHIPQIEIDLLKANIIRLYSDIQWLDKLNNKTLPENPEPIKGTVLKIKPVSPHDEKPADIPESSTPMPPEDHSPPETPEMTPPSPTPARIKSHRKETVDLFSSGQTIADKYAEQEDTGLRASIRQNKLNDIRAGIGINEKYAFVTNLFNGSQKDYNEAIQKLNNAGHMAEAMTILGSLAQQNEWEKSSDLFVLFESIVRRRHA